MSLATVAKRLINALYRRDHSLAAALADELFGKITGGLQPEEDTADRPLVADALGRMFMRNCRGKHLRENDCGFVQVAAWLSGLPQVSAQTVEQAAHLAMFSGIYAYHRSDYPTAKDRFRLAITYGDELGDDDIRPMSRLYAGRCDRKMGDHTGAIFMYDEALDAMRRRSTDSQPVSVVIDVLKAAEDFADGRDFDALHTRFDQAATYLAELNDTSTLGHIEQLRGRMFMRAGNYKEALKHLGNSLDLYAEREARHRGAARSLTNLARAKMLLAMYSDSQPKPVTQGWIASAYNDLKRAEEIYDDSHESYKKPEIETLRAELKYAEGNIDAAQHLAESAYLSASNRLQRYPSRLPLYTDLSTAKILECRCHLDIAARSKDTGVGGADIFMRAVSAAEYAADLALMAAEASRHPRRIARALLWKGRMMLMNPKYRFNDAKAALKRAAELLPKNERGYIYSELEELREGLERKSAEHRVVDSDILYVVKANDVCVPGGLRRTELELLDRAIIYLFERDFGKDRIHELLGVGEKFIQQRHDRMGRGADKRP